jgi:uncharacterized protein YegL
VIEQEIVELVCLVDRSISMLERQEQVMQVHQSILEEYKKQGHKCFVTTCLFSDKAEVLYLHNEIAYVKPLTQREYYVDGSTALYDVMEDMIRRIEEGLEYIKEEVKKRIRMYVITDGVDNCSVKVLYDEFCQLVHQKQEEGWLMEFVTPARQPISLANLET